MSQGRKRMKAQVNKYVIQDEHGDGWCILTTIIVLQEAGCQSSAVDQVASVASKLHWPAEELAYLRLALAEAIQETSTRPPPGGLLMIRVFLRLAEQPVPGGPHGKAGQGWGFFIVQKRAGSEADNVPLAAGQLDLVELFLYQE